MRRVFFKEYNSKSGILRDTADIVLQLFCARGAVCQPGFHDLSFAQQLLYEPSTG